MNIANTIKNQHEKLLKKISKTDMKKDYVIRKIYLSEIQYAADANIGRMLSEKEIKRLECARYEDGFNMNLYSAFVDVVREVTSRDLDWHSIDKSNQKDKIADLFPDNFESDW